MVFMQVTMLWQAWLLITWGLAIFLGWVFDWFLWLFGFGLGGKGWKEIEYLLSSSPSDYFCWCGVSSTPWDTSSLDKYCRKSWHSWASFWLCINITAELCPLFFNILTHRWQKKPEMIGDFEAKGNNNASSGIMLPTVCSSRRTQQYEVIFFFYPSNSKRPPVAS